MLDKISRKYRYAVRVPWLGKSILLTRKPKKIRGGYRDQYGRSWVGSGVTLIPLGVYKAIADLRCGKNQEQSKAVLDRALGSSASAG